MRKKKNGKPFTKKYNYDMITANTENRARRDDELWIKNLIIQS